MPTSYNETLFPSILADHSNPKSKTVVRVSAKSFWFFAAQVVSFGKVEGTPVKGFQSIFAPHPAKYYGVISTPHKHIIFKNPL